MADKTVVYRPYPGAELSITGDAADTGIVGNIERTGGRYEEDVTGFLRQVVPENGVVVDAGANIGVLSLLAARLAPRGRVYAFEPAPRTADYIRANAAANRVTNIEVEAVALSDHEGEIEFAVNTEYPAGAHLAVDEASITVPTTTLDAWASRVGLDRLDVLKIDVEGAELLVLAGAAATIARFRPVVVAECNAGALRRVAGRPFVDLYRTLRSMYPVVGILAPDGGVVPLTGETHLELRMGDAGVVDLVGLRGPASLRGRVRGWLDHAALAARHTSRRPPKVNFVVTPRIGLAVTGEVSGSAGSLVTLPVEIDNRSRWWLSSDFVYEPVHLSYRWLRPDGTVVVAMGNRTRLPEPLRPGGTAVVGADVVLPPEPGDYTLAVTLVQESWGWLDEIDPACRREVAVTVV